MASDDTINRFISANDVAVRRRLRETEDRLSGDVWGAAISRRARRAVLWCAAFAIIGVTGMGVMLIENVHLNSVHHEDSVALAHQTQTILRTLQKQDQTGEIQVQKVLAAIHNQQLTNTQRIAAIESVVDPTAVTPPLPASHSKAPIHAGWRPQPSRTP